MLMMHGANMKITDAKQGKLRYAYKTTRLKLLKTNVALRHSCNFSQVLYKAL